MTLEVMICTIDDGLQRAASVLLPRMDNVSYLVSCQYSGSSLPVVPEAVAMREDVRCIFLQGRGLSRNRNFAINAAQGDILLVADDDERLNADALQGILDYYTQHTDVDLVHGRVDGSRKMYPPEFVQSQEMTFRRASIERVGLRFDERFGLGSPCLASGEEDVFLCDARRRGLTIRFVPLTLCRIEGETTGDRFLADQRVQRSKGATFCYTHGRCYAYYKCSREALGWMLRCHVNPFPLLRQMFWGIRYIHV